MEILAIVRGNDFRLRIPIVKNVIQVTGEVTSAPFDAENAEVLKVFLERSDGFCAKSLTYTLDPDNEGNVIADVVGMDVGTYNLIVAGVKQGIHFRSKEKRQIKLVDSNERANITPTEYNGWDAYALDTMVVLDARGRDGLSAYEIAVLHGFVGTETEWLKALGIRRIYKSSTSGLVDTYTIVYANMATSTFTVTNGESAYLIAVRLGLFEGTEQEFIQWLRVPTILTDRCVESEHIDHGAVKEENLDPDILNQIRSAGEHGYALSEEFGDSSLIGVSQKALTQAFNRLWAKLSEITGEVLQGISMTVTPDYYIGEDGSTVHITANTIDANGIFEHIAFYINNVLVAKADKVDSFEYDTEINETVELKCVAKILGVEYTEQKVITHYGSFWMGGGSVASDVMIFNNLRSVANNLRGNYNITLTEGQKIIIVVGNTLRENFVRADMNGIEIQFVESTVTVNGNTYKVLTSQNTYQAGTYNIDINS